jgi:hypothetical protein
MSGRSLYRTESTEHPYISNAKEWAKQAGTDYNWVINWAVRLQEEALAFGNKRR